MIVVLLLIVIGLQIVQIRQHVRPTVAPAMPVDAVPSVQLGTVCDTTVFRLLAPTGEEEFEVSWHRGEIPPTYRHHDVFYTRGVTRPDGSVEFRR